MPLAGLSRKQHAKPNKNILRDGAIAGFDKSIQFQAARKENFALGDQI